MKNNIFSRAKAYVKAHPRTSFQDAIQKVKGKSSVSGTKRKKRVAGAAPKKAVSGVKRRKAPVRVTARRSASPAKSKMSTGAALVRKIERLELKRRELKQREMKDLVQLEINATHKKLDALKRSYK